MDHHEQHHQHKEHEREEEIRKRKGHEREHGKKWPIHPTWIVVIGFVLILAAILVWTLAV
jgi:type VI protein secretion system component VasF